MMLNSPIKNTTKRTLTRQSLRFFIQEKLLVLTLAVILCTSGLIYYIYNQGLDISARMSLTKIGYHYAQLDKVDALTQTQYVMGEFSVYIGKQNLPSWLTESLSSKQVENYELVKLRIKHDKDNSHSNQVKLGNQNSAKPNFILLTAIPGKSDRQIFIAYLFSKDIKIEEVPTPNIFETVTLATLTVLTLLIILVLWIAYRFHQKVLTPMESLAQIATDLDCYQSLDDHPLLKNQSEIGHIAKVLNQSIKRIKQTQEREKTFLQNASHELRTPIAVISSALDLIDRRQETGSNDVKDPLIHIRQSSNNMKGLTESLLWLSQADKEENNQGEPKKQKLSTHELATLVSEVKHQLSYLIEGRELNIQLNIIDEGVIYIEKNLLLIVISNLIRNAFEHSFEGCIIINVSSKFISVQDSGCGIKDTEHLMQRGKSNRESFGLGLDIVTQIAQQKGWHFTLKNTVENNLETGCTATLKWHEHPQ
ncbi:sensor histidine kinase [Marinomonas sp. PE14-40]|uniref:sensor histidine kinase n=1 Tax=Marinomonas sp. PE14-40 TaxID=3060621 RepID=UPI003F66F6FF